MLLILATLLTPIGGNVWSQEQNNPIIASAASHKISTSTSKLTAEKRTATTVTMSYSRISGADGYKIYRCSTIDGTYKQVGTSRSLTFTDKELKYNKAYYYKVRGYTKVNGKDLHSKASNAVAIATTFSKVDLKPASRTQDFNVLRWTSISGASKYKIYRSTSKDGSYKYLDITTDTKFIDNDIKKGQTYYYRVRAYKKINGIKYNGVYSDKVEIKPLTDIPIIEDAENTKSSEDEFAEQVLVLINQERVNAGLNELTMPDYLVAPANKRAEELKELFSHTRPDGSSWSTVFDDYGIPYKAAGENLAYGYLTPEEVVDGWMNSQGHRANILYDSFNQIGIGVYFDNGTVYWSQLFTD